MRPECPSENHGSPQSPGGSSSSSLRSTSRRSWSSSTTSPADRPRQQGQGPVEVCRLLPDHALPVLPILSQTGRKEERPGCRESVREALSSRPLRSRPSRSRISALHWCRDPFRPILEPLLHHRKAHLSHFLLRTFPGFQTGTTMRTTLPIPFFALGGDVSAPGFHQPPYDGQSQACAGGAGGEVGFENPGEELGGDPLPVVSDPNLDPVA